MSPRNVPYPLSISEPRLLYIATGVLDKYLGHSKLCKSELLH